MADAEHELARWVALVVRHPLKVLAIAVVAAAALLPQIASNLGIDTRTTDMFDQDLPWRQDFIALRDAFPELVSNILVVVDADAPEIAERVQSGLAETLGARDALFGDVITPGGGAFFERHGLLFLAPEELDETIDALARAQPFLGRLVREPNLAGLAGLVRQALETDDAPVSDLDAVLERLALAIEAARVERYHRLSWRRLMGAGTADAEAAARRLVVVAPALDFDDPTSRRRAIEAVRAASGSLPAVAAGGARVRVSGPVAMEHEELQSVASGIALGAGVTFAVVIAVLYGALRSVRLVFAAIVSLILGLVGTAGFAALTIGHLNLISVAFAVLYIGLGIDFAIHLCSRFRELLADGHGKRDALPLAASDVGASIVICAVTTSIGFFAFVPSSFSGVAELGLISGVGMYVSLLVTLTVLPALLMLVSIRRPLAVNAVGSPVLARLGGVVTRRRRRVRAGALLVGLLALAAVTQVEFDPDPMHLRDSDTESVSTYEELLAEAGGAAGSLSVLVGTHERARTLAERLAALPEVDAVRWLESFVPAEQEEKLAAISELAMILGPGIGRVSLDAVDVARDGGALRELAATLRGLESPSPQARGLERSLASWLAEPVTEARLARLSRTLLGTLPGELERLASALRAGRVTVESLPDTLVRQWRTDDGRYRLEVVPAGNISDNSTAATFVRAVESVTGGVTGLPAVQIHAGDTAVYAFVEALVLALVLISAFLLALTRRVRRTLEMVMPLLLAAVCTAGAAALLGVPFNFANVIALPLLLGVGVDNGIHMAHRMDVAPPVDGNLLATGTARAVVFSALTTVASFGSLTLSSHPGTASMGVLLSIGMGFALLATLVVLPALLARRIAR